MLTAAVILNVLRMTNLFFLNVFQAPMCKQPFQYLDFFLAISVPFFITFIWDSYIFKNFNLRRILLLIDQNPGW